MTLRSKDAPWPIARLNRDALLAPKPPARRTEGLFRRAGELRGARPSGPAPCSPPAPSLSLGGREGSTLTLTDDYAVATQTTFSSRGGSDRSKGNGRYPFTAKGWAKSKCPIPWAQGRGQPSACSKAYGDGGPLASRTSRGDSMTPGRGGTPRPSGQGQPKVHRTQPGRKARTGISRRAAGPGKAQVEISGEAWL